MAGSHQVLFAGFEGKPEGKEMRCAMFMDPLKKIHTCRGLFRRVFSKILVCPWGPVVFRRIP